MTAPPTFGASARAPGSLAYDWAADDDRPRLAGHPRRRGCHDQRRDALSTTFSGSAAVPGSRPAVAGPQSFAEELWFKHDDHRRRQDPRLRRQDHRRQRQLRPARLHGPSRAACRSASTPAASGRSARRTTYNDGQWHHVVATLGAGGMSSTSTASGSAAAPTPPSARPTPATGGSAATTSAAGRTSRPATTSPAPSTRSRSTRRALSRAQVQAHYTASGRTSTRPARPADAYGAAVYDAGPDLYWRLDEAAGSPPRSTGSTGNAAAAYSAGVVRGGRGAPANPAGSSIALPGDRHADSGRDEPVDNPTVYSAERGSRPRPPAAASSSGSATPQTGTSGNYDRHVYMQDDGKLLFGIWTGAADHDHVARDLQRRHVAPRRGHAGPDGMKLYVDGALVGERTGRRAAGLHRLLAGGWRQHLGRRHEPTLRRHARRGRRLLDSSSPRRPVAQHYKLGKPASAEPVADRGVHRRRPRASRPRSTPSGSTRPRRHDRRRTPGTSATAAPAPARRPSHTYAAAGTYPWSADGHRRPGRPPAPTTQTVGRDAPAERPADRVVHRRHQQARRVVRRLRLERPATARSPATPGTSVTAPPGPAPTPAHTYAAGRHLHGHARP